MKVTKAKKLIYLFDKQNYVQQKLNKLRQFCSLPNPSIGTKPHPEPYLTGLRRFGATKEETLVVEDSNRGLNSAVAAGIDCVIVHNNFTKTHDFSQASYRIKTLTELKDIILNNDAHHV